MATVSSSAQGGLLDSRRWWEPWVNVAGHLLGGTIFFVLFACMALGLEQFLVWAKQYTDNDLILGGLTAAKLLLFGADLVLYVSFTVNEAWRFVYSLDWT